MIIYCINIHEQSDKWRQSFTELSKLGKLPIRWPAMKINPGWEGCKRSHYSLLRHLLQYYPNQLLGVFEDDIEFCVNDPQEAIEQAVRELPDNWDMLYLGGTPNEQLKRVSSHLFRTKKTWTTHAIIYNPKSNVIPFIIENMLDHERIDVFYADVVQERYNCYIASPMICTQKNGFSDIRNKVARTGDFIKSHYDKFVK